MDDEVSNSNVSLGDDEEDPDHTDFDLPDYSSHLSNASSALPSGSKQKAMKKKSNEEDYADTLIHQSTRNVFRWRSCILLVWTMSSVLVSVGAFFYLSRLEDEEFQRTVQQRAESLRQATEQKAKALLDAWQGESDDLTAFTASSGSQWPFVVIPYWEKRATNLRQATCTRNMVAIAPLVAPADQLAWQRFSVPTSQNWIQEGRLFAADAANEKEEENQENARRNLIAKSHQFIPDMIYKLNGSNPVPVEHPHTNVSVFAPLWQTSPPPNDLSIINYDMLSNNITAGLYMALLMQQHKHKLVMSDLSPELQFPFRFQNNGNVPSHQSLLVQPIFNSFNRTSRHISGLLFGFLNWDDLLQDIMPATGGVSGMMGVVENTCGSSLSYLQTNTMEDTILVFLGQGDFHDEKYQTMGISAPFGTVSRYEQELQSTTSSAAACHYSLHFYPTSMLEDNVKTKGPKYFALLLAVAFFIFAVVFYLYANMMRQVQNKIQSVAIKASNVVSSLFPSTVRDRILEDALQTDKQKKKKNKRNSATAIAEEAFAERHQSTTVDEASEENTRENPALHAVKNTDVKGSNVYQSKPIADLFPECTVLFADIVGFTAWSSTREPCQVFDLLETIYYCFDEIAKKRHVFKVETIGDCYVAVTGIPTPRKDHAVQMAKFARDAMHSMDIITKKLEIALGPDTSDLSMRFGLHSGPVTAGVLRGERSRFQLFGDTVNTAARMESAGKAGRIHVSQKTANCLAAAGKEHWFMHREDKINAKGLGELSTYWIDPKAIEISTKRIKRRSSNPSESKDDDDGDVVDHPTLRAATEFENNRYREDACNGRIAAGEQRLIDWTVKQLLKLLKQIVARRAECGQSGTVGVIPQAAAAQTEINVFEEVKEIIRLPESGKKNEKIGSKVDPETVQLHPDVTWQLFDYVTSISTLYRNLPFHNFEHASHVTLSVLKMLSRIVTLTPNNGPEDNDRDADSSSVFTEQTNNGYGISTDPLTQFAVVFSALIHDVDHVGVSNAQLAKENSHLARVYKNQSVLEQNSVNIAWDMLMDPAFSELRNCIYATEEEFIRFRQLVVNTVMATDIVDKDLKALRNARWEKAFQTKDVHEVTKEDIDRKATIVIEHLIQASDVSHTMQHWHVYKKWNAKLFRELYVAYKKGRMEHDPASFWYKGEIGFFDFYIIPLAKKLRDCGVFGVSCDEYLSYAIENRAEWEKNGEEVVKELIESVRDLDEKYDGGGDVTAGDNTSET